MPDIELFAKGVPVSRRSPQSQTLPVSYGGTNSSNIDLLATSNTDTDTATPSLSVASLKDLLQLIWAKIRSLSNRMDGTVGEIFWWPKSTPPANALFCNGQAVSRTTYASLFAVLGTSHGTGNGSTTFNLPDMRGYFVRGYDPNNVRDPEGNTRGFGTEQAATFHLLIGNYRPNVGSNHNCILHPLNLTTGTNFCSNDDGVAGRILYKSSTMQGASSIELDQGNANEYYKSRPVNINLLPCIRAK